MRTISTGERAFEVDGSGFLLNRGSWHERFAEAIAPDVGIAGGLTEEHLRVIRYIRRRVDETGKCPLSYHACAENDLSVRRLKELFPTGYLRGACKLAGVTYREAYLSHPWARHATTGSEASEKVYRIDLRGFLVDAAEWDEEYARHRAEDMGMGDGFSQEHLRILYFLRDRFAETGQVATVFELCERLGIDLCELERLFPTGYHRGAVKLAGLRAR